VQTLSGGVLDEGRIVPPRRGICAPRGKIATRGCWGIYSRCHTPRGPRRGQSRSSSQAHRRTSWTVPAPGSPASRRPLHPSQCPLHAMPEQPGGASRICFHDARLVNVRRYERGATRGLRIERRVDHENEQGKRGPYQPARRSSRPGWGQQRRYRGRTSPSSSWRRPKRTPWQRRWSTSCVVWGSDLGVPLAGVEGGVPVEFFRRKDRCRRRGRVGGS